MKYNTFRKKLRRDLHVILAVVFILWGVFAFFTPLTPASWLFFVGLFIIFGREKTQDRILQILGEKWSKKLRIKRIFEKIPPKFDK